MKNQYVIAAMSGVFLIVGAFLIIERTRIQPPHNYSNDALHKWAAEVLEREFPSDKSGFYDMCWKRSEKLKLSKDQIKLGVRYNGEVDLYLLDTYSDDVRNACALMLSGAEW